VLATGTTSSSTINGFNKATGYTERTYRVYPADAPSATAIVVAPASTTDTDGNLIPDACETVPGDLDGNGVVNGADLALLLNAWGPVPRDRPFDPRQPDADLDGNGEVGAPDIAMLLGSW